MQNKIATITCSLLISVFLTSCATDSQTTKAQGAGLGALLGAVGGAAIGYATGGEDGALKGALIGAGTGAIGGYAYGSHVANKKEKYASQEDYLDACIAEAGKIHSDVASYNQGLRGEIAQLKKQNDALASSGAQRSKLVAQKKAITAKRTEANEKLARITDEIRIQSTVAGNEKAVSSAKVSQLNSQIGSLKKQKTELQKQVSQLASMESRIAV